MRFRRYKSFIFVEFSVDISFVESPPRLQSSQNMLKTLFKENNIPPNLSSFEFKLGQGPDKVSPKYDLSPCLNFD